MASRAYPYWLIHEPGKTHGFGVVDFFPATNAQAAIDEWRKATDPTLLELFDFHGTEVAARLITEPQNV